MYTLVRSLTSVRLAIEQVVALLAAWLIAELFYKFHSFTLELAAFLATWLLLDWVVQSLSPRLLARSHSPAS